MAPSIHRNVDYDRDLCGSVMKGAWQVQGWLDSTHGPLPVAEKDIDLLGSQARAI
jgi:hypothetical protein